MQDKHKRQRAHPLVHTLNIDSCDPLHMNIDDSGGGYADVTLSGNTEITTERTPEGKIHISITTTNDGRIGAGGSLSPSEARKLGERLIAQAVLVESQG